MPIRHCQKCGLKVLIDENQTTTNPFYCQRCSVSVKAGEPPPPPPPEPAPEPPPTVKPQMTKVVCPYCKASFSGRIPQKPAKGGCPICQKELILLPNGDIRAAAGFDPARWQEEAEAPPPPAADEETGFPSDIEEESTQATPLQIPEDDTHNIPLAAKEPPAEPAAAETEPSAAMEAPPEEPVPAPEPIQVARLRPAASRRLGTSKARSSAIASPSGTGRTFVAAVLMLLPLIICPTAMGLREPLKTTLLPLGGRFSKGFLALYLKIAPPPPAPKKAQEAAPAPPPPMKAEKADSEQQQHDEDEINKLWISYKRDERTFAQRSVGATEEEKAEFESVGKALSEKLEQIKKLREEYKKLYGRDYNPVDQ